MNNARIAENFMWMLQKFWVLKNKKFEYKVSYGR